MKLNASSIKWLHVEASSNCNAWCPTCNRNDRGYGLAEGVYPQNLIPDVFKFTLDNLPNLETIQFCGNLGDPIISPYILDLLDIAIPKVKKIQIHTNGSLRNVSWWSELAQQLKSINHNVWFGLDGLSGVHEIYRQGTDFDKIIANATSFINAGGIATWQFIPYAHNEHQIVECLKLSKQLGFKHFKLAKLHRIEYEAKHYKTGAPFLLAPPSTTKKLIRVPKLYNSVDINNCMHFSYPSIYLSSSGKYSVCCYQSNKTVDTLEELFYNTQNLKDNICLYSCGS